MMDRDQNQYKSQAFDGDPF